MNDFYPTFTDSFLKGQNILYAQFNEIEFYIEDKDQENLYFQILSKLFPEIKFEKIFPLNGKTNVIKECENYEGNKNKIFIVDKDFDDILNQKFYYENLFYLDSYSIENILINKQSIYELIKEKSPTLKDNDIEEIFDYDILVDNLKCLRELASLFLIIKIHELGVSFLCINCHRDFNLNTDFTYKSNIITDYKILVETTLKQKDGRFSLNSQMNKVLKYFNNKDQYLINIPGKYLLILINELLKKDKLIHQYSIESISYKLAKDLIIDNLANLKNRIDYFIRN